MISTDLPTLRVSCLARVSGVAAEWAATHVVSLLNPGTAAEELPRFATALQHRSFFFLDAENPEDPAEFRRNIHEVLDHTLPIPAQPGSRLIVHCHAGASRSTALCYVLLAQAFGPGREDEAFRRLLEITEKPWPNRQLAAIADERLGRDGAMLAPLDAYRARHPKRLDAYYRLNEKRGILRVPYHR
jgi:predicted protein tyrosine phosphatase